MACAKFLVGGRVQGVGFRASARRQALALRLCGQARNLADGRVEVLAWGDAAALGKLEEWLWRGPPLARVDELLRIDFDDADLRDSPPRGFSIDSE